MLLYRKEATPNGDVASVPSGVFLYNNKEEKCDPLTIYLSSCPTISIGSPDTSSVIGTSAFAACGSV